MCEQIPSWRLVVGRRLEDCEDCVDLGVAIRGTPGASWEDQRGDHGLGLVGILKPSVSGEGDGAAECLQATGVRSRLEHHHDQRLGERRQGLALIRGLQAQEVDRRDGSDIGKRRPSTRKAVPRSSRRLLAASWLPPPWS